MWGPNGDVIVLQYYEQNFINMHCGDGILIQIGCVRILNVTLGLIQEVSYLHFLDFPWK